MKEIHKWDPERTSGLMRAVIRLEYHPHEWKIAKGITIPIKNEDDNQEYVLLFR
jgi:hypothetical protein